MEYIAILDASNGRAVIKPLRLEEGADAAFERIQQEEGLSAGDCQWQVVSSLYIDFGL